MELPSRSSTQAHISGRISRAAWVALLVVAVAYAQPERPVKFITLPVALGNDIGEPSTRVFRTEKDWNEFLRENSASVRGRHSVDFGKQMLAAIFAGQKPTGGYSLQVTQVVDESRPEGPTRGVVHYRLASPPPDSLVIQVLTYPFVVIRIDRRFDQLEFRANQK